MLQRIFDLIDFGPTTDSCYVWRGGIHKGQPYLPRRGRHVVVRRYLYEVLHDRPVEGPLRLASYRCHPLCVNPRHLVDSEELAALRAVHGVR